MGNIEHRLSPDPTILEEFQSIQPFIENFLIPSACSELQIKNNQRKMIFINRLEIFKEYKKVNQKFKILLIRYYFNFHFSYYLKKIEKIIVSEDKELLITLSDFYSIDVYSFSEKRVINSFENSLKIYDLILVKESNLIIYITANQLKMWDYKNDYSIPINISIKRIGVMAACPCAKYIAVGDQSGKIYLINEDKSSYSILKNHKSKIETIEFTKDSLYFMSAGGDLNESADYGIRIWDTKNKCLIYILIGHTFPVCKLTMHSTRNIFLSVSKDCTVRIWDFEKILQDASQIELKTTEINLKTKSFSFLSALSIKQEEIWQRYQTIKIANDNYMLYMSQVFSLCKENAEIFRIQYNNGKAPKNNNEKIFASAFFTENEIIIFDKMNNEVNFYDILIKIKTKSIQLFIKVSKQLRFAKDTLFYTDEEQNIVIIDINSQQENYVVLPGTNSTFLKTKIENSRYLLTFYDDKIQGIFNLTIWDMREMRFIRHFIFEAMPSQVKISKNGETLILSSLNNPYFIKEYALNHTKAERMFILDEKDLENLGISDDCKFIISIKKLDDEVSIFVWNAKDLEIVHKIKTCKANIFIVVVKNNIYKVDSNNKTKVLKVKNIINFTKSNKKAFNTVKYNKYGIYIKGNYAYVYRISSKVIIVLEKSAKRNKVEN